MVFIILIVVIFIIIVAYYFSSKQVIIRTLAKTPNKPVGGLKTNSFTKVTGKALHVKQPLIAPFSKRKCVYYKITIQQKRNNGKNSHWRTLISDSKIQEFFIETKGEHVIVRPKLNPKNFKSYLVIDKKTSSGTFNKPTKEFLEVLKKYNIRSDGFLGFNKSLRYTEAIIELEEIVTVAGIAKWKHLKEPVEGYAYSKIAELVSTENQKLIITDLPDHNFNKRR
ncbi:hypothetical protein [Polaribacter sp. OB-PA-B3]